jgi:hypothetical protein
MRQANDFQHAPDTPEVPGEDTPEVPGEDTPEVPGEDNSRGMLLQTTITDDMLSITHCIQ